MSTWLFMETDSFCSQAQGAIRGLPLARNKLIYLEFSLFLMLSVTPVLFLLVNKSLLLSVMCNSMLFLPFPGLLHYFHTINIVAFTCCITDM